MKIVLLKPVLFSHDQPISSVGTEVEVDFVEAMRLIKIGAAYRVDVSSLQVSKQIGKPGRMAPPIDLKAVKKFKGKK